MSDKKTVTVSKSQHYGKTVGIYAMAALMILAAGMYMGEAAGQTNATKLLKLGALSASAANLPTVTTTPAIPAASVTPQGK